MRIPAIVSRYAIFVALLIECVVLSAMSDSFLTVGNLSNVLRQNAFTSILAAGMTFVILTGGIDLSVGSVVGVTGVVCADLLTRGVPIPAAIAATLLLGFAVGLVNEAFVSRLRIHSF